METTNPLGDNVQEVVDNLIMETPKNQDEVTDEVVEAILDTETETEEEVAEDVDVDDVSDIDQEIPDTEDIEEEEPTVQQELYQVKIDGEDREVTLDELKRGYSGQKYIQKGMSDVASQKKEIEKLTSETSQERQMLQQMMQQMQQGNIPIIPEYPAEELKQSDPFRHSQMAEEYRRAVEQRQQWEQQVKIVAQREKVEQERLHVQNLEQQAMRLSEWMPEYRDEKKRADFMVDMSKNAKKFYKLTDDQIGTVKTAEEVMILNDAVQWRKLQDSKKTKVDKKTEGARPVVKPSAARAKGAAKASNANKQKAAMSKSGSIDDVASWLTS